MKAKTRKRECSTVLSSGIDYITGRLNSRDTRRIQLHLQKCKHCRREIQLLKLTDTLSRITREGALPPENLLNAGQVNLQDIRIPVQTVADVTRSLHEIDRDSSLDTPGKNSAAIRIVTAFLTETGRFLKGKPSFDSGLEWMHFEKRKAGLLREIFKDDVARHFISALKIQAEAFLNQGILFNYTRQFDKAGSALGHAFAIAWSIDDWMQKSRAERLLGEMEFYRGDLKQAETLFQESLKTISGQGWPEEECILLRNLGNLNFVRGDLNGSMVYLEKALEISTGFQDPLPMARDLNNLASLHYQLGDLVSAIAFAEKSLESLPPRSAVHLEAQVHGNLGTFHSETGNLVQAQKNWRQAIALFTRMELFEDITLFHKNLAIAHYRQMDLPAAASEIAKAIKAARLSEIDPVDLYLIRGRIHRKIGKVKDALADHEQALIKYMKIQDHALIKIATREQALDLFASGKIQDGWVLMESLNLLRRMPSEPDSIFKLEDLFDIMAAAHVMQEPDIARKCHSKAKVVHRNLLGKLSRLNPDLQSPERQYLEKVLNPGKPNI
ncbi:tetratricopeptide repeat protein [bacterium]|nr:tetratricopeptide repeat protein [candidate division CSSED10-310 bacterium]